LTLVRRVARLFYGSLVVGLRRTVPVKQAEELRLRWPSWNYMPSLVEASVSVEILTTETNLLVFDKTFKI